MRLVARRYRSGQKRHRLRAVSESGPPFCFARPDVRQDSGEAPDVTATNGAERLDSWKEIASYLKRDVTTVRRWEKREHLPVHRHLHERRDSVYAYTHEIDQWWQGRHGLADNGVLAPDADSARSRAPSTESGASLPIPVTRRTATRSWLARSLSVASLIAAAWVLVRVVDTAPGTADAIRFAVAPPEGTTLGTFAVSRDGRHIALTATDAVSGESLLWIRSLDALSPRAVPDSDGARDPFWSPASDRVGFFASGKLWTVALAGGNPRALSDAPDARGGAWNGNDVILFAPTRNGPLYSVSAKGGRAAPVTTVAANERGHLWPEFLPDGSRFLFLADSDAPADHALAVGSLDGSTRKVLVARASSNAVYDHSGHLLFARERQLVAQRFDSVTLDVTGEAEVVVDRVHQPQGGDHKTDASVSADGVLVYRAMQSPATRLVWRERSGVRAMMIGEPREHTEPALSPDQSRLAVAVFDPRPSPRFGYGVAAVRSDIWMFDVATGSGTPFVAGPAAEWGPLWSPDGSRLVFSSNRSGRLQLFVKHTRSPDEAEVLLPTEGANPVAQSWSPDGRFIVYSAYHQRTRMDQWLLPVVPIAAATSLLGTEATERQGQISPDGKWLAYASDASGRDAIYIAAFPSAERSLQVSSGGGADPRWSRSGRDLFYVAPDRRLMTVPNAVGPGAPAPAVALFDTGLPPDWYSARNLYDVSGDGRFLFMSAVEDDRTAAIAVVVRWRTNQQRGTR
jgi:Tol biopolymer transport system component